MKNFLYLFALLLMAVQIKAAPVDERTAKSVASAFISSQTKQQTLRSAIDLQLSYVATYTTSSNLRSSAAGSPLFYIYNAPQQNQYVIVSGDDRAMPILGYSDQSTFDSGDIPPNIAEWLEGYKEQIQYAIDKQLIASAEVSALWTVFQQGQRAAASVIVPPLVQTRWNQSPYYNDLCPYNSKYGERTITGCVATAMAQILRYWKYPAVGIGSHNYVPKSNPDLGPVSVNFSSAVYNWNNMPVSVTSANPDVALLMYHCGVSVNMDYGTSGQGGSSAYLFYNNHPSALLAFRQYFGYKYSCSSLSKSSYADSTWAKKIKAELNANRPVLYSGRDSVAGGHAFVCDGYNSDDYFHFNWGWNGAYDGYFALNALDLGLVDFSTSQSAIFGIEPPNVNPTADIYMNAKPVISPSLYLSKGQGFSVKVNFKNNGGVSFTGAFAMAIYDQTGKYIASMTTSAYTLAKGASSGNITFSSTGISSMTSGKYDLYFFNIPTGASSASLVKTNIDEGGYYSPYMTVNVASSLAADSCEANNTQATAFEINPVFTNGMATCRINNTSLHSTTDVDYYKINIPPGYQYSVNSFLYDSGTSSTSTLDGQYLFFKEDSTWSTAEDFEIQTFKYNAKSGNLYFKVEPAALGQMGTYSLRINLTQTQQLSSAVNSAHNESRTSVYPSISKGDFVLDLKPDHLGMNDVSITDISGKTVSRFNVDNDSEVSKAISLDVANGVYIVNIRCRDRMSTFKVIVSQ